MVRGEGEKKIYRLELFFYRGDITVGGGKGIRVEGRGDGIRRLIVCGCDWVSRVLELPRLEALFGGSFTQEAGVSMKHCPIMC